MHHKPVCNLYICVMMSKDQIQFQFCEATFTHCINIQLASWFNHVIFVIVINTVWNFWSEKKEAKTAHVNVATLFVFVKYITPLSTSADTVFDLIDSRGNCHCVNILFTIQQYWHWLFIITLGSYFWQSMTSVGLFDKVWVCTAWCPLVLVCSGSVQSQWVHSVINRNNQSRMCAQPRKRTSRTFIWSFCIQSKKKKKFH